jgi:hypothetical protein
MAPTLDDLPNELFEHIVQHLNLPDICNLRSGSRQLASKSTQTHFKSFFRRKHVDLSQHSLDKFARATQASKLCRRVEHLVLVGVVDDAPFFEDKISAELAGDVGEIQHGQPQQDIPETTHKSQHALRSPAKSKTNAVLPTRALRNLGLGNNTHHRLRCLSLETRVFDLDTLLKYGGRLVPNTGRVHRLNLEPDDVAARAFHFTMECLAISGLTVEKLEIHCNKNNRGFFECNGQYGLYSTELIDIQARYPRLRSCFASMTSLSVGLCPPRPSRTCEGDQSSVVETQSSQEVEAILNVQKRQHSPGLGDLLRLTENLQDLDLQYCGQTRCGLDAERNHKHAPWLFRYTAASGPLPHLRICRIKGLRCHPDDLLRFLQRTQPRRIDLQSIFLEKGSWQRIFEHITGPQSGIESVLLKTVTGSASEGLLWFPETPTPESLNFDGEIGDHTLERRGDAVRRPINYRFMSLEEYQDLSLIARIRRQARA